MARKALHCRKWNNTRNCSVTITGTEEEVLDLAVIHGVITHGYDDPHELRRQLRPLVYDEPEVRGAYA